MNLSTVKWAQWDKTQSRKLLGLFICVCIVHNCCTQYYTHNIAQNRPDNFPPSLQTITIAPMISIWGKGGFVPPNQQCQSTDDGQWQLLTLSCWDVRCRQKSSCSWCAVPRVQWSTSRPWQCQCTLHVTRTTISQHTRHGVEQCTMLSLIHIWRCRRSTLCRSRWSPYH